MPKKTDNKLIKNEISTPRLTLNLRIRPEDKALIDRAARAAGKNRTEFILEASRRAAEEILADLHVINVSPDVYKQFVEQLDISPKTNEALRKTMKSQSPWDN